MDVCDIRKPFGIDSLLVILIDSKSVSESVKNCPFVRTSLLCLLMHLCVQVADRNFRDKSTTFFGMFWSKALLKINWIGKKCAIFTITRPKGISNSTLSTWMRKIWMLWDHFAKRLPVYIYVYLKKKAFI